MIIQKTEPETQKNKEVREISIDRKNRRFVVSYSDGSNASGSIAPICGQLTAGQKNTFKALIKAWIQSVDNMPVEDITGDFV